MGYLSCLFKNGAEGCKTAGVEEARCLQGWGGHSHPPGTGFPHWALAVALWGWEEGSFEPRNVGASGYGMGLGMHGFLIPLCKASQPRLSRGWTEACPGCLWCFGLYPLLRFHCRHHKSMATHLHIWRPSNTALGDILVLIKNIPPFLLLNPLNFQPLFLLWWHWHWLSIQVFLTSIPLHPCCQPVFKVWAKRSRSKWI